MKQLRRTLSYESVNKVSWEGIISLKSRYTGAIIATSEDRNYAARRETIITSFEIDLDEELLIALNFPPLLADSSSYGSSRISGHDCLVAH